FDVHLPRARTGAVDPVGGAHHLVVAPPVAVEHIAFATPAPVQAAQVVGDHGAGTQVAAESEQGVAERPVHRRHYGSSFLESNKLIGARAGPRSPAGRTSSRRTRRRSSRPAASGRSRTSRSPGR